MPTLSSPSMPLEALLSRDMAPALQGRPKGARQSSSERATTAKMHSRMRSRDTHSSITCPQTRNVT